MSTTTAQAWLAIAHGGGRWTAREVVDRLPGESERTVENTVFQMGARGFLKIYEKDDRNNRVRFGVTADCRVPRGITAWEVVEAMGLKLRPEVDEGELVNGMTVAEVLRKMAVQKAAA